VQIGKLLILALEVLSRRFRRVVEGGNVARCYIWEIIWGGGSGAAFRVADGGLLARELGLRL